MKVGVITNAVKSTLGLRSPNDSSIYLGETNIRHMVASHPEDYEAYKDELSNILLRPDYIGINLKDSSIEYVKNFAVNDEYVKVAVRISTQGKYYARSLYVLNERRVENFIRKGTLKKVDFFDI